MKKIKLVTIFTILLLITFISLELILNRNVDKHYRENNNIEYKTSTTKPAKPTIDDLPSTNQSGYVFVKCIDYPDSNPRYNSTRTHAGYISLANSTAGWKFGEVYANDGRWNSDEITADKYPWFCDLTLESKYYLNLWNNNYSSKEGVHYLANPTAEVKATLVSDGSEWYFFNEDYPLVVWTTHESPTTSYSVIHEYYMNNKKVGEYLESISNAYIGDIIYINEISKINTYEEKNYKYISSDVNSIQLTNNKEDNVIRLRYELENNFVVIYTDGVLGEIVFPDQGYEGLLEGEKTPQYEGTDEKSQKLPDGTIIPIREGYLFMGWAPAVNTIVSADDANEQGEIIYTATWQKITSDNNNDDIENQKIKVIWHDGYSNSDIIKTESIEKGSNYDKLYPNDPEREEYVFIGWGKPVEDKYENIHITAEWEPINNEDRDNDKENSNDDKDPKESIQNSPITSDTIITTIIISLISLFMIIILIKKRKSLKQ